MFRSQLAIAAIIMAFSAADVSAAVRRCGPVVSSQIANASSELTAKRIALQQWRKAALKYGVGWDSWRLAYSRALQCYHKDSGFECVAFGAPCIVDQTPRSPPKGPDDKGKGI